MKSIYVYFINVFILLFLEFYVISKNPLANPRSQRFNLCFSSNSYVVLVLVFRSFTHFEWIFAYGVQRECDFILSHVLSNHLGRICWKYCSFPIDSRGTVVASQLSTWVYVWILDSGALIQMSPWARTEAFDDRCCAVSFGIRNFESSYFVFIFFQNCLGYPGSLVIPYEF